MENNQKMLEIVEINEPQTASDGRLYLTVGFINPENPFEFIRKKTILQSDDVDPKTGILNGYKWRIAVDRLKVGMLIPGEIVTREVEPYSIGENTVTKYTTVVLSNESVEAVFRAANHPFAGTYKQVESAEYSEAKKRLISQDKSILGIKPAKNEKKEEVEEPDFL